MLTYQTTLTIVLAANISWMHVQDTEKLKHTQKTKD